MYNAHFIFDDDIVYDPKYTQTYDFVYELFQKFMDYFPECDDNHDVTDLLVKEEIISLKDGVIVDSEQSCFYAYFPTEALARTFIEKLNKFLTNRNPFDK